MPGERKPRAVAYPFPALRIGCIEGAEPPGNLEDLDEMCVTRKPELHCIAVPGANHFSVLDAVSKKLAARIVVGVAEGEPLVRQKEFPR